MSPKIKRVAYLIIDSLRIALIAGVVAVGVYYASQNDTNNKAASVAKVIAIKTATAKQLVTDRLNGVVRSAFIGACIRGNQRSDIDNLRGAVLSEFLRSAYEARQVQANLASSMSERRNELKTAEAFKYLRQQVFIAKNIDCERAFNNPTAIRGIKGPPPPQLPPNVKKRLTEIEGK